MSGKCILAGIAVLAMVAVAAADVATCSNVVCYNTLGDCLNARSGSSSSGGSGQCGSGFHYYACQSELSTPICRDIATGNQVAVRNNDCHQGIWCYDSLNSCRDNAPQVYKSGFYPRTTCSPLSVYACREDTDRVCRDVETGYQVRYGGGVQDPHFKGFDGTFFYFDGEAGQTYNIISDRDVQVNANFIRLAALKGTYMGQLGILFGDNWLVFDPHFGVFFNGTLLNAGEKILEKGAISVDIIDGHVDRLVFNYGVYNMIARVQIENSLKAAAYINLHVAINGEPERPHGILGQSALPHSGKFTVEGVEDDYRVVDGLLGTGFKYNRYEGAAAKFKRAN